MRGLLLPRVAGMGREGVVEDLPIDVLGMRRQMACDRRRQIVIAARWSGRCRMRFELFGHPGSASL